MGFFGRVKVFGRNKERLAVAVGVVVEVHDNSPDMEKKDALALCTPRSAFEAERELPELLWQAAHSPEVLCIKTSMLRDPTLDVLRRALSVASSTAVASSAASSPVVASPDTAALVKASRAPKRLHLYDFKQIRGIGGGGCGSVFLVKHIPTGRELAMKVIDKRFAREAQVIQEQRVLKDIGTRGIASVMEFVGSFHNPRHYFLLTEYYPGGDLNDLICRWDRLPMASVKFYAAELLCAATALHGLGYVHRDLKPENVLISSTGHVVLADFGFTKSVAVPGQDYVHGSSEHELLKTCCGTMSYLSPEQILREPYAFTTDAWSFAVIVFKMVTGKVPWIATFEDGIDAIMERVTAPFDTWLGGEQIDSHTREFLEGMLVANPYQRPTLKEAMTHSWWGNVDWKAIASGDVPVPDVGSPPVSSGSGGDDEVFFGSFSGGGVYLNADDPNPEFNYASPILAADGYDDDDSFVLEAASLPPQDSFDDIPLDDTMTCDDDIPSPPATIQMMPPPMLFGMAAVTTTVTVTTEEDIEPTATVSVGVAAATQVKSIGIFDRLKSWVGRVASGVAQFCSRLTFR